MVRKKVTKKRARVGQGRSWEARLIHWMTIGFESPNYVFTASASPALKQLEEEGLVERVDGTSGRKTRWVLTKKAHKEWELV